MDSPLNPPHRLLSNLCSNSSNSSKLSLTNNIFYCNSINYIKCNKCSLKIFSSLKCNSPHNQTTSCTNSIGKLKTCHSRLIPKPRTCILILSHSLCLLTNSPPICSQTPGASNPPNLQSRKRAWKSRSWSARRTTKLTSSASYYADRVMMRNVSLSPLWWLRIYPLSFCNRICFIWLTGIFRASMIISTCRWTSKLRVV